MVRKLPLLLALVMIVGCQDSAQSPKSALTQDERSDHNRSAPATRVQPRLEAEAAQAVEVPPDDEEERIQFYLSKLGDRDYYDLTDHGHYLYTAVEELAQIGGPAIPHLIEKLETSDPFELKLALYALMLASQDPEVKAQTGGEYVRLSFVLSEEYNSQNKEIALAWWEKFRSVVEE